MNQATPAIRALARYLLTLDVSHGEPPEAGEQVAWIVFEKLRLNLSKLVGSAGFQALLTRALALSKAEALWLEAVRVRADGTLEGFREIASTQPVDAGEKGSSVLLAQLLGLLVTFIGEALTLRLLRDVWPEAQVEDLHLGTEETPA